jgi:hypothetical protein
MLACKLVFFFWLPFKLLIWCRTSLSPFQPYVKYATESLPDNVIFDPFDHTVLGLVLQVLVWVVKSYVQNSVASGFIGLFYGPVFPAALAMTNDVLPEEVHMISMALM